MENEIGDRMEYKIGDRVIGVGVEDGVDIRGRSGVVVEEGAFVIGIAFDEPYETFHDCSGKCARGHGWYVVPRNIEPEIRVALNPEDLF